MRGNSRRRWNRTIKVALVSCLCLWPFECGSLELEPVEGASTIAQESKTSIHKVFLLMIQTTKVVDFVTPLTVDVTPQGGGVLSSATGSVRITVPAGTVPGNCTLRLSGSSLAGPLNTSDTGLHFELELLDQAGHPVISLSQPVSLTINYGSYNYKFINENQLAIYHRQRTGVG